MTLLKKLKFLPILIKEISPIITLKRNFGNTYCKYEGNGNCYDFAIVGGGIVGCAVARELLLRHSFLKIAVIEKENKLAFHQTGHNSGVIHSGIYYTPGSIKAKLCVEGLHLTYGYLRSKNLPYKKCGKLIVATNERECEHLLELFDRGLCNNVPDLELIDGDEIQKYEPYCKGFKAILSPHTGIVDYEMMTNSIAHDFCRMEGDLYLNFHVNKFNEDADSRFPIQIPSADRVVNTKFVITCAGLHSDVVAGLTGCKSDPRIIPFRGEYLILNPEKNHLINGNIYPVPDPRYPFLGVHFTPRMDGSVLLGPNAILAFKREGYKLSDLNFSELFDIIKYPGFLKLARVNIGYGVDQIIKSTFIKLQAKELQKYIPDLDAKDLLRGPSGVRAQAMDVNGKLVDDFVFDSGTDGSSISKRVMHIRNAPSPAATSSLAIAQMIVDKVECEFFKN